MTNASKVLWFIVQVTSWISFVASAWLYAFDGKAQFFWMALLWLFLAGVSGLLRAATAGK